MSTRLTYEQKLEICRHKAKNPSMSQTSLVRWATEKYALPNGISQPSLSKILKRHQEFEALCGTALQAKRPRTVNFPQLEEALFTWVLQCQNKKLPITGELIKAKGRKFAEQLNIVDDAIHFSSGWLQRFQDRHKLKSIKSHGESGSADVNAMEVALPDLRRVIARYTLCDVYNMDETGLFYSMAPDRTIAQHQVEGMKKDKTRITIAFTSNADGSHKLPPFFIGYANKPRCFNKKTGEQLGFYYRNNKKAWMTGVFFQEWLQKFDREMKEKNRRVLLLLDNAPSHVTDNVELTNVRVQMLPPNTTSRIQPMDAGIISAFKRHYRRLHIQNAVDRDDRGELNLFKVDQLTAMKWTLAAWKEISATTITNCFKHTGLFAAEDATEAGDMSVLDPIEAVVEDELVDALRCLRLRDPMSLEFLLNPHEEEQAAHVELTDEEILFMVREENDDGVERHEEEEIKEVRYTRKEQLHSITVILSMLDITDDSHRSVRKSLRELQTSLRFNSTHQSTLEAWLQ